MKILHVHKYYHAKDGAGRYEFDLMRLEEEAGHTVAAFAMDEPRNAPSAWSKYFVSNLDTSEFRGGIGAIKQFARALWSLEAKDKMEEMLEAFRPDVVHVHNIYTHLSPSVLLPCKKRGIPVVLTVHDYGLLSANYTLYAKNGAIPLDRLNFFSIVRSRFIKHSLVATFFLELVSRIHRTFRLVDKRVDRYLPVSHFVKDVLVRFGINEEKISVVPPAVSRALYGRTFVHDREDAVLFAGRLDTYKGIQIYLQAAALCPEVTFYIAGTGPLVSEVEAFMRKYSNVKYLGFVESETLWNTMARVRATVVPSVCYETFGLTALESMAVGTPVIASDIGGLSELVKRSESGQIVPPGDVDALANAIIEMMQDPAYDERAERARQYAFSNHSPEKFLSSVLDEYKKAGA